MEIITDRSGCSIKTEYSDQHLYLRGCQTVKEQKEIQKNITTEEFFPDDILLVTYARSGSHWTLEILNMLTRGTTEYGHIPINSRVIELRSTQPIPNDFNLIRPRIFHTHAPLFALPEKLRKLRMVFVYRNPKDVAYSLYKFTTGAAAFEYEGRFEDFILLFQEGKVPFGDYFRYMNSWEKFIFENNKCYFSYEQLSEEPMHVMEKLAAYLDVRQDKALQQEIIEKCSLQKMKKNTTLSHRKWKDGHGGFLRKGVIGDWKNHFTVAMSEEFDRVFARRMPETHLEFQFEPRLS